MKNIFLLLVLLGLTNSVRCQSARVLDSLAQHYFNEKDYPKANTYAAEAIEKRKIESPSPDTFLCKYLERRAEILFSFKNFDAALNMQKQAADTYKKIAGEKDEAYIDAFRKIAVFYFYKGETENAMPILLKCKTLYKEALGETHPKYLKSISNISVIHRSLGQYQKALATGKEALSAASKASGEESIEYGTALENLAIVYDLIGSPEDAEPLFLKAKEIRGKILGTDNLQYANSLQNLAVFYDRSSSYAKAKPLYLESVELYGKFLGKEHETYAIGISNLAALYISLKQYEESEKLLRQAQNIYRKTIGVESDAYIKTLQTLAINYERTEQHQRALAIYDSLLIIRAKIDGKEHPEYAVLLSNSAVNYMILGEWEKAKKGLLASHEIYKKNDTPHNIASIRTLIHLADLYTKLDSFTLAESYLMRALSLIKIEPSEFPYFKSTDDIRKILDFQYHYNFTVFDVIKQYVAIWKKMQREENTLDKWKWIYSICNTGVALNERIKNDFSLEEDKLRTLSNNHILIQEAFAAAYKLEDEELKKNLFSITEKNKSALLRESLKASQAHQFGDLPDSLYQKEIGLQKQLKELQKQLTESNTEEEKNRSNSQLNELHDEISRFKIFIENSFPKYYQTKYKDLTINTKEIQSLLDKETAFLEFFVGDSITYLFYISQTAYKILAIPIHKNDLQQKTTDLRKSLSDYDFITKDEEKSYALFVNTAHWFYKTLLAEALENTDVKHLIIVPDGELGHLPFETFLTAAGDDKEYNELPYLLHKFKISYNYSATLWRNNLRTPAKAKNGRLLGFSANYEKNTAMGFSQSTRSPHLLDLRNALVDLPAAKQEVEMLSKLFRGDFFYDLAANERNFKEKAGEYNIIHLAMHGLLNQRSPILSSLAFTEDGDSTEDNFLQAYEISHLQLNAQLVVLSACETGYGKFQQGEGVMSLARSFMYAGVPSLVVSMWQVNDASTSQIMQLFYKNLAKGMDKAEALQQAKLEYIGHAVQTKHASSLHAHPAFWAPFIQLGDSRPIRVETRLIASLPGWGWWIGGIGVLFLLLVLFMLRRNKLRK